MKCIRCGTEVNEGIEKCPKCGTPAVFSEKYHTIQYENRKYENPSARKLFLAIVILMIVAGLGFLTLYLYNEQTKKNNNPNYVTDSIDYSKKSLVESNARHYMDAVEMYIVYHVMDANDKNLTNRIYSLKNQADLDILKEMQVKVEKPVDGWFAVDRQGMVVAAELKFKAYKKAVAFTSNDKVNAILDKISGMPSTIEEAITSVQQDIISQSEQK